GLEVDQSFFAFSPRTTAHRVDPAWLFCAGRPSPSPRESRPVRITTFHLVTSLTVAVTRGAAQQDRTVASPISLIAGTVPIRLHIGGLIQTEARTFLRDDAKLYTDDLVLRRARLDINGTVARWVDFRILPDFGLGTTTIQDAWIDIHY